VGRCPHFIVGGGRLYKMNYQIDRRTRIAREANPAIRFPRFLTPLEDLSIIYGMPVTSPRVGKRSY